MEDIALGDSELFLEIDRRKNASCDNRIRYVRREVAD
jgi:hypothetical protein